MKIMKMKMMKMKMMKMKMIKMKMKMMKMMKLIMTMKMQDGCLAGWAFGPGWLCASGSMAGPSA